jgi:Sigma-70, region 4
VEPSEGAHPCSLAGRPVSPPRSGSPPGSEPDGGVVAAALAALRREHRQVIVCTFYRHLSTDDAAARLGISVRDVKRRACSGLKEIRRILEERGVQAPCPPGALPDPRPGFIMPQ